MFAPATPTAGENVKLAFGSAPALTVTVPEVAFVPPMSSVTISPTVNVPTVVNVWVADDVDPENAVPSPKSHAYLVIAWPVAAVDPDALKKTTWPTTGEVGEATNEAVVAPPPEPPAATT